jgi:hypothetical protein
MLGFGLRMWIEDYDLSRITYWIGDSLNCGCLMENVSMISVIIKGSLDEQIAINRELKLEIQSLQNQLIKVR